MHWRSQFKDNFSFVEFVLHFWWFKPVILVLNCLTGQKWLAESYCTLLGQPQLWQHACQSHQLVAILWQLISINICMLPADIHAWLMFVYTVYLSSVLTEILWHLLYHAAFTINDFTCVFILLMVIVPRDVLFLLCWYTDEVEGTWQLDHTQWHGLLLMCLNVHAAQKGPLQNRLLFHLQHKFNNEKRLMEHHANLKDVIDDQLSLASIHYLRSHYQEAIDIYKRILLDNRSVVR